MVLSWALIGMIVGMLLGLTGAGGALIAVPLFVSFNEVSIRDATVLSLVAVVTAALLNWIVQIKKTDFKLGLLLFAFSTLGTFFFVPIKGVSPDGVIVSLFISVAFLSLFSVWKKTVIESSNVIESLVGKKEFFLRAMFGGFCLGGLVTMTGLGGGVVIIPFLKSAFNLPFSKAIATGLITITLSSLSSLWFQRDVIARHLDFFPFLALFGGAIVSAMVTRQIIKRSEFQSLNLARKFLITFVIIFAAGSLANKAINKKRNIMNKVPNLPMRDVKNNT